GLHASDPYLPVVEGTYRWRAHYSGFVGSNDGFPVTVLPADLPCGGPGQTTVVGTAPDPDPEPFVIDAIPVPTGTHSTAADPTTHMVFASSSQSPVVYVIDGTTDAVVNTVAIPGGAQQLTGVAVDPVTHLVYV